MNNPDAFSHMHRSAAMFRSFEQGVFWPRWFPAVYDGLGAPTFHHYSPGLYWLIAAIHAAGIRLDQALKLVVTAALILSGFGAYAWLRYAFSPTAALVGAALFLFAPFIHTRAFYFHGGFPQLLALLLLPVCLWAITALHLQPRARHWPAAVAALIALVFSHNMTTLTGAIVLTLYCVLLTVGYRSLAGLLRCALAALIAALLSAPFWLPALADLSYVQINSGRAGTFYFGGNFLHWGQLFRFQSPVLDSRVGNALMTPATIGIAAWMAVGAGLVSALLAPSRERRNWGLAGGLFVLAMLTLTLPVSELLWQTVPGLSFLQFPGRFLSIAPLGALPAAALAVDAWPVGRRWLPGLALLMVSILALFPYLFPGRALFASFKPVKELTAEDTRAVERWIGNWGMSSSNEFLVQGATIDTYKARTAEPDAARLTWRSPHEAVADLAGETGPALLRLHFHPGWSAGERAQLAPGLFGWMQVSELRNPDQPLVIRWEGTAAQRWGERLSLVGLFASVAGLLLLALRGRGRFGRRGKGEERGWSQVSSSAHRSSNLTLGAMAGCLILSAFLRFGLDRSSRGPFLLNSPPGQLAFSVEGQPVTIGDPSSSQATLLGWELLSSRTPKPGAQVRLRLYWQGRGQINEALRSFLHLYTPSLQHSWAVENLAVNRPGAQIWDPDKYYVHDLLLTLPHDLPPASYSLVAGLSSNGERLTVPGSTEGVLHLRTLDVAPTRPGFLQRERPATVARAATADGLGLQGYDMVTEAGGPVLRLFWETGEGVANDWITYVHLHDARGERVAQFDGPALAGLLPTSQWHTNALYVDRRRLVLPAALQPGAYLLRIGLYDRASGERLPFQPDDRTPGSFEDGQLLVPFTLPSPADASG